MSSQQFESYAEAISCAVDTLAALQKELGDLGHLVFGRNEPSIDDKPESGYNVAREGRQVAPGKPRSPRVSTHVARTSPGVPEFFSLRGLDPPKSQPFAKMEPSLNPSATCVSVPKWIFGQYNRLLPIKAASRGLARLLCATPIGVTVDTGSPQVASKATSLGDYLSCVDAEFGHTRDQRLATAFPTSGSKVAKSEARFANQFVARTRAGQLGGLLSDLKLINWSSGRNERFQLTEPGWKFALMRNPILDEDSSDSSKKFSDKEVAFLLDHVARCVPAEGFAYFAVLEAIHRGSNTPNGIDAQLFKYGAEYEGRQVTKSFLASQRSGAISRMTDLGLMARNRSGTRVVYVATPIGDSYLNGYFQRQEKKG